MVNFSISGLRELLDKLHRLSEGKTGAAYEDATRQAVNYVLSRIPKYPPPPLKSKYRRTGDLGRSIAGRVELLGSKTVGKIGTNKIYSPFVIGDPDKQQAHMHRGRWWTLVQVVIDNRDSIRRVYQRALSKLLKG